MSRNAPRGAWLSRVENSVGEGMPDVYAVDHDCYSWVELKAVKRPKRPNTRFLGDEGLRNSQESWHMKAAIKGLRSYILVRDDHMALYLLPNTIAETVNEMPLKEILSHTLADNWAGIFAIIIPNNRETR